MSDKYNRQVGLLCPTCGCDQFEFESGVEDTIELAKCASCNRILTKDELIAENSESIETHVKEIGEEVKKDLVKGFREGLKKAFRGNKNITFK